MSFLTRNNFTAGPNNPPGTVLTWVSQNIRIIVHDGIINNDNKAREGNGAVLGTLLADQENYNIFNGTMGDINDFTGMKSPWCLVYIIATNTNGNQELHILSCHRRDQTSHYFLIESAAERFSCSDFKTWLIWPVIYSWNK